MKVVKLFNNRMDAEIAKGFLESSGITAFVFSDDEGGFNPAMSTTFGVKLSVSDDDLKEAQSVLEKVDQASHEVDN